MRSSKKDIQKSQWLEKGGFWKQSKKPTMRLTNYVLKISKAQFVRFLQSGRYTNRRPAWQRYIMMPR